MFGVRLSRRCWENYQCSGRLLLGRSRPESPLPAGVQSPPADANGTDEKLREYGERGADSTIDVFVSAGPRAMSIIG